jgi:heme-degrading monooxygenase HmoA
MAIAVIVGIPSREAYEQVNEQMFGAKRPTGIIDGNIIHTAGEGPNGFRVVDVWESQEAFESFLNERVVPAMQALGMEMEGPGPEIVDLINVIVNEEATTRV